MLSGRHMAPKASEPRWLEQYTRPGQEVTLTGECGSSVVCAVASSPIDSRVDSVNLDASLVEVVLTRADPDAMFRAEPGSQVEVSPVHGDGFANPMNRDVTLVAALEDQRPLVIFAASGQGIAAARAALQWDPVQAAATQRPVVLVYLTDSPQTAAFMTEWNAWRAWGVTVEPVYMRTGPGAPAPAAKQPLPAGDASNGAAPGSEHDGCTALPEQDRVILSLDKMLSNGGKIAQALGSRARHSVALFAGLESWQSKSLLHCLAARGIHNNSVLYI